jgi:hypothetical protein
MKTSGLLVFGVLIGILAALSTAAGTTLTLLGLLFALIGGSLLSWFDREKGVQTRDRNILLAYSGNLAVGGIMGLGVGFGLRLLDQAIIQPIITRNQVAAVSAPLEASIDKLTEALRVLKQPSGPRDAAAEDLVASLSRNVEELNLQLRKLAQREPRKGSAFALNNARSEQLRAVALMLGQDAKDKAKDPEERKNLEEWQTVLNSLANLTADEDALDKLKSSMSQDTRRGFEKLYQSETLNVAPDAKKE